MYARSTVSLTGVVTAVVCGCAGALVTPTDLAAQCRLDVKPASQLGYGRRGDRCEGLYVEQQSAPLNLRVVSLMRGGVLPGGNPTELEVSLPRLEGIADSVRVIGSPREPGINWAFDRWTSETSFRWDLDVLIEANISLEQIGLVAIARDGSTDPVFVPVDIDGTGTTTAAIAIVFHLPAASRARLCIVGGACTGTLEPVRTAGYYDGYFAATLPGGAGPAGLVPVIVQWRKDGNGPVAQERFDIYRW